MKPYIARRKGRWYCWNSRADVVAKKRPLGIAGRSTPLEAAKAFFALQAPPVGSA